MNRHALADGAYLLALLALPLVGVDPIHAVSGQDLGAGLQPAYALLAFAWGARLFDALRDRHGRPRMLGLSRAAVAWCVAVAAALLLSGLGLVVAPAPLLGHEAWPRFARQIVQVGVMLAFLIYPAAWTRDTDRWERTVRLLAWATMGQLAYAVIQGIHVMVGVPGMASFERLVTSNPAILSGSTWLYLGGFTELPRLRGTMCEPLYLGSFLVGVLPLLAWSGRRRLAAAGLLVLLLTWSRAAWLAAVPAALAWWMMRRRAGLAFEVKRAWWLAGGALVLGLAAAAWAAGPEALGWPARRLLQTLDATDWSNLTRFYSMQAAWRAWLESPIVGVGWGQFPYHFYALVDLEGLQSQFNWPVVNSWPLLVLCEAGLVGFCVLVVAWLALASRTIRALRTGSRADRGRLAAAAAGGFGLGLQLLFFSQYNLPHLWVVPGLWLAALATSEDHAAGDEGGQP